MHSLRIVGDEYMPKQSLGVVVVVRSLSVGGASTTDVISGSTERQAPDALTGACLPAYLTRAGV